MHRKFFLSYKNKFKKSTLEILKLIPLRISITFLIYVMLIGAVFITLKIGENSIVSNVLSFLSIIAIIILYVFTESYDYKTANTQMGDKKQKIKDLYELLKENDYSKKNQIKQLRNEVQIEINKIKTKSAGVEKNIIRFFELLYVPIILNSLNSIFRTNDVTYSVEMYNVLFVFFFVFMMFLLIYFIYTRIINKQLYWYDMFSEDLQGVLDTKFDIEDDDILEVK